MMDDERASLIAAIAKLDTVIDNLTELTRQTKSLREKAKVASALKDSVALRERFRSELAKLPE